MVVNTWNMGVEVETESRMHVIHKKKKKKKKLAMEGYSMVKPDLQCTRINEETVCSRHYLLLYSLSTLVTDSYCIVSDTGIGSSLGKRSALGPYISGCLESVRQTAGTMATNKYRDTQIYALRMP